MIESVKLIHGPIFEGIPYSMNKIFTFSLNRGQTVRLCRKPMVIIPPKDEKMKQSLMYKSVYIYNKLSEEIRFKNPRLFSKKIYKYFTDNFPMFEIPKNE